MKVDRIAQRGQLKLKAALADQAYQTGVQVGMQIMRQKILTAAFHLKYEQPEEELNNLLVDCDQRMKVQL